VAGKTVAVSAEDEAGIVLFEEICYLVPVVEAISKGIMGK
jgi:hypothetical protein